MAKRKRDKPKRPEPKRKSCTICLSLIRNEASLDNCSHTFCRKCIVKWAETENTCPQCRKSFTCVSTKKSTRLVRKKRQGEDNRTVDMIMNECLWRFVTDDNFKYSLADRFINDRTPFISFICQALNNILSDTAFVENIKQFCVVEGHLDFRDDLDDAAHCIKSLIRLDTISITI
jgi:hypothetical protein